MDAIDSVEVAIICALIVDAFKVDPVSVENDVNDNPGAFILVAVSVDTVSVDVTASVLVEMVDPVSVENVINCAVTVDILHVDPVSVDVTASVLVEMVDPVSVENVINCPVTVDALNDTALNVETAIFGTSTLDVINTVVDNA